MSYRKIKLPPIFAAIIILFCESCNFIDLQPVGYSAFPATPGTVLPDRNTAVGIRFDTKMNRLETQKAFSVSCNGASVSGDLSWNDKELSFVPQEGWQPGLRYTLSFDGTILAQDGRDARAFLYVPFYALSPAELPYLTDFSPADGTSTGVSPAETILVLRFSLPMERFSTEDAVSIDGISEKEFRWSDNDRVLEVFPKKDLLPWTVYRWTLGEKALSKDRAPLVKGKSASFITDTDRLLPEVLECYPLMKVNPDFGLWWQRTGSLLENGLGHDQAIGIDFNKAMDESVQRAIRFEPALAGRCESRTKSSLVFIPDKDPESETLYTLIVSADARDLSGLRTGKEYRFNFTPDIPYLTLLSFNAGDESLYNPANSETCGASVSMPDKRLEVIIRFSFSFVNVKAQADAVQAIRLEPYFPLTLPYVNLRSASWLSDDSLYIVWEGAEPGLNEEAHYYKLVLPGKRGGITNGNGSYLKDDFVFMLEAS